MTSTANSVRNRIVKVVNLLLNFFAENKFLNALVLKFRSVVHKINPGEIQEIYDLVQSIQSGRELSSSQAKKFVNLINKNIVKKARSKEIASLIYGSLVYRRTGITPRVSHAAFVSLYEKTNGLFQDIMHSALFCQPQAPDFEIPSNSSSFFAGSLNNESLKSTVSAICSNGYAQLNFRLADSVIQQIESDVLGMRFRLDRKKTPGILINPSSPPDCNVAYADPRDLAKSVLIRELVEHPLLIQLVSQYLNANAKLLNNVLWYSFPSAAPSSEAAQFFHYDLDTFRWVKLFIYLTDVDLFSGPHEYVEKTHHPGRKNPNLLLRSYSRVKDEEIDLFQTGKRRLLTGSQGSLFLADTRCFHKGTLPLNDYRLVLQPIYGASGFSYAVSQ